jgi:hypothetical protein
MFYNDQPIEVILDMKRQYTCADYLQWLDNKRRELINGFVRMMSPASSASREGTTEDVSAATIFFIKRHKSNCTVFTARFDAGLPENGRKKIFIAYFSKNCLTFVPRFGVSGSVRDGS